MFGWGSNDYGQLGCGTEKRFVKEPTVIEVFKKIEFKNFEKNSPLIMVVIGTNKSDQNRFRPASYTLPDSW